MQVGDVEGMKNALVENSMFERLYTPSSKQNLMTYWTFAGGYKVAAEMHLEALNSYLQVRKLGRMFNSSVVVRFVRFVK